MKARARRGAPPKELPIEPTQFDVLLDRLGIGEDAVKTHPVARQWVRSHYRNCFVPEKVLDQVGIPDYKRVF